MFPVVEHPDIYYFRLVFVVEMNYFRHELFATQNEPIFPHFHFHCPHGLEVGMHPCLSFLMGKRMNTLLA